MYRIYIKQEGKAGFVGCLRWEPDYTRTILLTGEEGEKTLVYASLKEATADALFCEFKGYEYHILDSSDKVVAHNKKAV